MSFTQSHTHKINIRGILFSILLLLSFLPSVVAAHSGPHDVIPFAGGNNLAMGGNTAEEVNELESQIDAKKERIKVLEESIASYKDDIEAKRQEAVSLANQLSILDARAEELEVQILMTEERLATIELEIQRLSIDIDQSEAAIDRQQLVLGALLREILYEGEKPYIEVAANYDNLSDFFNQVQYNKSLETDIRESVQAIQAEKIVLEADRAEQEGRFHSYERNAEILTQKKEELDAQRYLKQDLLSQTRASEQTFQALLNSLKNQARDTEKEIAQYEADIRRKLQEEERLARIEDQIEGGLLSWPTPHRYITARFHDVNYPYRHIFEHSGLDIAIPQGTALRAGKAGYIGRVNRCALASCFGYVLIIHSDGISTLYGHMSQILVEMDQYVSRGDVIGYSGGRPGTIGAGPFTTGAHLHMEVRKDGIPVDPLGYLVNDYD